MESRGKYIGDIRPENILVNEEGYVKIITQYSWPEEPNRMVGYSKTDDRVFLCNIWIS